MELGRAHGFQPKVPLLGLAGGNVDGGVWIVAEESEATRLIVTLRTVHRDDVAEFFEHQLDNEACAMAAFPTRDRATFEKHWDTILANDGVRSQTILVNGEIAGNVCGFNQGGKREIGYWIGRAYWGRGVATSAVRAFLELETDRPLFASVSERNQASRRVLEKCGFVRIGQEQWLDDDSGSEIAGLIYELDGRIDSSGSDGSSK